MNKTLDVLKSVVVGLAVLATMGATFLGSSLGLGYLVDGGPFDDGPFYSRSWWHVAADGVAPTFGLLILLVVAFAVGLGAREMYRERKWQKPQEGPQ